MNCMLLKVDGENFLLERSFQSLHEAIGFVNKAIGAGENWFLEIIAYGPNIDRQIWYNCRQGLGEIKGMTNTTNPLLYQIRVLA